MLYIIGMTTIQFVTGFLCSLYPPKVLGPEDPFLADASILKSRNALYSHLRINRGDLV